MEKRDNKEHSTLADEVEEIVLDLKIPERKIKIGAGFLTQLREEIVHVLVSFKVILVLPGSKR